MTKLYPNENILEIDSYFYSFNKETYEIHKCNTQKLLNSIYIPFTLQLSKLKLNESDICNTPLWEVLFDVLQDTQRIIVSNKFYNIKDYYILENPYTSFIIKSTYLNIKVNIDKNYIISYETILSMPQDIEKINDIAWMNINGIFIRLPCYKIKEADISIDFASLDRIAENIV